MYKMNLSLTGRGFLVSDIFKTVIPRSARDNKMCAMTRVLTQLQETRHLQSKRQ